MLISPPQQLGSIFNLAERAKDWYNNKQRLKNAQPVKKVSN